MVSSESSRIQINCNFKHLKALIYQFDCPSSKFEAKPISTFSLSLIRHKWSLSPTTWQLACESMWVLLKQSILIRILFEVQRELNETMTIVNVSMITMFFLSIDHLITSRYLDVTVKQMSSWATLGLKRPNSIQLAMWFNRVLTRRFATNFAFCRCSCAILCVKRWDLKIHQYWHLKFFVCRLMC